MTNLRPRKTYIDNTVLVHTHVQVASVETAPYLVMAHAFGKNNPALPISISGTHKILLGNPRIQQYGIGLPVDYYHVECENYTRDNIVVEGLVAESYGTMKTTGGLQEVYTWSEKLQGFTRVGPGSLGNMRNALVDNK